MGVHTKDEDQQPHQLGHLNLDKNLFSVIVVEDGDIAISSAKVRGGIDWRALNGAEAPPSQTRVPIWKRSNKGRRE